MAKYTTELRTIMESMYNNMHNPYPDVNAVIEATRANIFNFDYPIWDEAYKPVLESKILKHYYMREIGLETYGYWKLRLEVKMQEIMPYYNQLYLSTEQEYDMLTDYREVREHHGTGSTTDTGTLDRNGTDTESGTLKNTVTGTENLTGKDIQSKETDVTSKDTGSGNKTGTDDKTVKETIGNDGTNHTVSSSDTTTTGKENGTNDLDSNTDRAYSDTPMNNIANVQDLEYLTNYTNQIQKDQTTTSKTSNGTSKTDYTEDGDFSNSTTRDLTDTGDTTETYSDTKDHTGKTTESGAVDKTQEITKSETTDQTTGNNRTSKGTETKDYAGTSKTDWTEIVYGKTPGRLYPEMIEAFRKAIINIDLMIIEELSDLFMGVY